MMPQLTADEARTISKTPAYLRTILRRAFEGETDTVVTFATVGERDRAIEHLSSLGYDLNLEGYTVGVYWD